MTTERDPQIEALLRSQTPPAHRAGFWDDVRDDLDAGPDHVTPARVVPIDGFRRRAPWLLAAAAVVIVAVIGAYGLLGSEDDGDVGVAIEGPEQTAPDPTGPDGTETTPDSSSDPAPDDGPLRPIGTPEDRGSGRVIAASPDGQWLYVADDAGTGETSCEGAPRQALYVEPFDGGERRLAVPSDELDATTAWAMAFDGDGRAALNVQCEGFSARIFTADVADDGTLVDGIELRIPEPQCHDGTVDGIGDIAYQRPGTLVVAARSHADGSTESPPLCKYVFSLPDTESEATLVAEDAVQWLDATPDGRVVTATDDGRLAVDGDVVFEGTAGFAMALSPSGAVAAITTDGDDVAVPLDGGEPLVFATDAYEVAMLDDRNGIMTADVGEERVVSTFRAGDPAAATPLLTGSSLNFVATPDRVFVTVLDDAGVHPRIVEIAIGR